MDSNMIYMGCRLKDSLMLVTCGQADVIKINHSLCCIHTTHTYAHVRSPISIFLRQFSCHWFWKEHFQVYYYEEILELYGVTATLLSVSHSLKTELGKGMVNICHCHVLVKEHTGYATIIRSVTALFGPLDAAVLWYFDTVYSTSKWLVFDPVMGLTSEIDHSHQRYFIIPANSTDQSHSWEMPSWSINPLHCMEPEGSLLRVPLLLAPFLSLIIHSTSCYLYVVFKQISTLKIFSS